MFAHLDRLIVGAPDGALRSSDINTFSFEGRTIPLVVQPGIWKPAFLMSALTLRTTFTAPDKAPPYVDRIGDDGLLRYAYQGEDPAASDNRAAYQAMVDQAPLAYFVGVAKGIYTPIYPVWIVAAHPASLQFAVAVDRAQLQLAQNAITTAAREYALSLTKQRLHQRVFRTQVLHAYADRCAMCHLRHVELLDAAHILPDGHPQGDPVVPNGLSLCKIHHAAFDANILGVRPDLIIEVRRDILEEQDGPMLLHGLQGLSGGSLTVPRQRLSRPDPIRLETRYDAFRSAAPPAA
jgi:putative restriction endonuclease